MNNLGKFLWKLFSATMVFLCNQYGRPVFADTATSPYLTDEKMKNVCEFKSANTLAQYHTVTLCKIGTYLAKCGSAEIGTEWLKGMTKTKGVTSVIRTPNYYSYDSSTEDVSNMENLRKFFEGTQTIEYYKQNESNLASISNDAYLVYRNQILTNFCTNASGQISYSEIHCEKCPNNALVAASTVEEDSDTSGKILCDSWNVHTIADCYMNEFSDETGTYVYVNNATSDTSGDACYYSNPVVGTALYYK